MQRKPLSKDSKSFSSWDFYEDSVAWLCTRQNLEDGFYFLQSVETIHGFEKRDFILSLSIKHQ